MHAPCSNIYFVCVWLYHGGSWCKLSLQACIVQYVENNYKENLIICPRSWTTGWSKRCLTSEARNWGRTWFSYECVFLLLNAAIYISVQLFIYISLVWNLLRTVISTHSIECYFFCVTNINTESDKWHMMLWVQSQPECQTSRLATCCLAFQVDFVAQTISQARAG